MSIDNLPNGTLIYFSSKFDYKRLNDWKHAITKPLHYGIQWGTGSKYHHVGIMFEDWLYEALGKTGVRKIRLADKVNEVDNCVELTACKPSKLLTTKESKELDADLWKQLGKKYPTLQAFGSILTKILFWQTEVKSKTMFCSKLIIYAFLNLYPKILKGIIPRTKNPEESYKVLRKVGLIDSHIIIRKAYSK